MCRLFKFNFNTGKIKRLENEIQALKKKNIEQENRLEEHRYQVNKAYNYLRRVSPAAITLYSDCEEDKRISKMMRNIDHSLFKEKNDNEYYLDILGVVKSMRNALIDAYKIINAYKTILYFDYDCEEDKHITLKNQVGDNNG